MSLALFCKFFENLRSLAMSQSEVYGLNLQVHKNAKLTHDAFSHGPLLVLALGLLVQLMTIARSQNKIDRNAFWQVVKPQKFNFFSKNNRNQFKAHIRLNK